MPHRYTFHPTTPLEHLPDYYKMAMADDLSEVIPKLVFIKNALEALTVQIKTLRNPLHLFSPLILSEIHLSLAPELLEEKIGMQSLYRDALLWGMAHLPSQGFDEAFVMQLHAHLIGSRAPGYRTAQNHLIHRETQEITLTPPPPSHVSSEMSDWISFMAKDTDNALLHGLIGFHHYLAIHPFMDGNGRTGRMLLLLYLRQQGLFPLPVLPLADFIQLHRQRYADVLLRYTRGEQSLPYLHFMIECMEHSITMTTKTVEQLHRREIEIVEYCAAHEWHSTDCLEELLLSTPVMTVQLLEDELNITTQEAARLMQTLEKQKLFLRLSHTDFYIAEW